MGEIGNSEGGGVGTVVVGVAKVVAKAAAEKFFGAMPEAAPVAKPLAELIGEPVPEERKILDTILRPQKEQGKIENVRNQLKGISVPSQPRVPQAASPVEPK